MADPMKIRAKAEANGVVDVKVLFSHEMETGQRKDSSGNVIPAHFIQNVTATYDGRTVYRKLAIIRQMAYEVCGEMMTYRMASELQTNGGKPHPTYVAFAPLLAAQERPYVVVVAPLNPD